MNPFSVQTKWDTQGFLRRGKAGQTICPAATEKQILGGKKVLLKSSHSVTHGFVGFSSVGFIFVLIFFSFSNLLFKRFHSCFCSWRARGNIPFPTAKPALPAHWEPWQPCNLCPHPLPAAPSPPPTPSYFQPHILSPKDWGSSS